MGNERDLRVVEEGFIGEGEEESALSSVDNVSGSVASWCRAGIVGPRSRNVPFWRVSQLGIITSRWTLQTATTPRPHVLYMNCWT